MISLWRLFLEVPLWFSVVPSKARRIDGVLIPGEDTSVYHSGSYSLNKLQKAVDDQTVHLIEAKKRLNRTVVGQLLVGKGLFKRAFPSSNPIMVAICSKGNSDLEYFCAENGIKVEIFSALSPGTKTGDDRSYKERIEHRSAADSARFGAFLRGWSDAIKGKLYQSVHRRKTHANMGNLFGWIYGKQSAEFIIANWERYLLHTTDKRLEDE